MCLRQTKKLFDGLPRAALNKVSCQQRKRMRNYPFIPAVLMLATLLHGCGGGNGSSNNGAGNSGGASVAAPTVTTKAAQNGALIATLTSTSSGAVIYYTVDGSTPTISSPRYEAPFLVASNVTVKAIASSAGTLSSVTSQAFSPNVPST